MMTIKSPYWIAPTAAALAAMSAMALQAPGAAQVSAANPGAVDKMKLPPGYLPREALPDSLALLPPPPPAGSAAMQRDEEVRNAALKLRGSARWKQAAIDAEIAFPRIPDDFSCAMGISIAKETTPRLYGLMAKMMIDVGLSTYGAKNHYKRVRPFVVHKAATCYPKDEATLRGDGSYPSGHSALGWGWALALAEINPDRDDELLQRGREFGTSRLVCDAHWQSDVDAGRVIAAGTVARLHADATFRADLDAARAEIARARQAGIAPGGDCAAEGASLIAR